MKKADLVDLVQAFEDAAEARQRYRDQLERADRLFRQLRDIFDFPGISGSEAIVPVEVPYCDSHKEHGLSIKLELMYRNSDGGWVWAGYGCLGGESVRSLRMLELVCKKINELIDALREFKRREDAKTKDVSEFLDKIEGALTAIRVANSMKPKPT
jgi:hypothetical protein